MQTSRSAVEHLDLVIDAVNNTISLPSFETATSLGLLEILCYKSKKVFNMWLNGIPMGVRSAGAKTKSPENTNHGKDIINDEIE